MTVSQLACVDQRCVATVPGMKTMKIKVIAGVVAALVLLGGCGGADVPESAEQVTVEEPETPTEEPEPGYDGKAYARSVVDAIETEFGAPIASRCDAIAQSWHCYFDRYKSSQPGWLYMHLKFPGDTTEAEAREISETARLHTFNLAGLEITDLNTVVSYANGLDTGATNRSEVLLLN